jgi:hypothetical protein
MQVPGGMNTSPIVQPGPGRMQSWGPPPPPPPPIMGAGIAPAKPNAPPGPEVSGVGIFFQVPEHSAGSAYVQHIVPGSSADRCGMIRLGDELFAAGEVGQSPTKIEGKGLHLLREKILGKHGSFVLLQFRRKNGEFYEIELMRGSPEYIEMMNVSSGLKDRQQTDMRRIQELENQVSSLKRQVQAYSMHGPPPAGDPRVGPLEEELRARMDDLKRFEDMLLRAKQRTSDALAARDEAIKELEMLKNSRTEESKYRQEVESLRGEVARLQKENRVMHEKFENLEKERSMLKQELSSSASQLENQIKKSAKANNTLQEELNRYKNTDFRATSERLEKEVDDLREQLRKRDQRNQSISRKLKDGHNMLAQVCIDLSTTTWPFSLSRFMSPKIICTSLFATCSMVLGCVFVLSVCLFRHFGSSSKRRRSRLRRSPQSTWSITPCFLHFNPTC